LELIVSLGRKDGFKLEFPDPAETAEKHRRRSKPISFPLDLELIVFLGGDDGLLKIVSADPAETAVEYRRKGEPIGFFLDLRLIVLPGAYVQRDDGSKPQKLPRITTQESPILWKFAESLGIRVAELKTRNPPTLRQHLQEIDAEISKMEGQHNLRPQHYSADADTGSLYCGFEDTPYAIALGVRISRLEEIERITYNFKQDIKADGRFGCPDRGCDAHYKDAHRLSEHWRCCHGSAGSIVAGRVCYPCRDFFENTRKLILHEKNDHGEEYGSRVERYLPFFKQSRCKFDRSHLIFDFNIRYVLVTKDFIDLFPPTPKNSPPISDHVDNLNFYDAKGVFDDPNFLSRFEPLSQVDTSYRPYDPMNNRVDNLDLYDVNAPVDDPHFQSTFEPIGQVDTSLMNNQIDGLNLYDINALVDNPDFQSTFESIGQTGTTYPTCDQDGETFLPSIGPAATIDITDSHLNDTGKIYGT
jgi:hypothetical protein